MKSALFCASLLLAVSAVAQTHCRVTVREKINVKAALVFTGTLQDKQGTPLQGKTVLLTSADKKVSNITQAVATDSQGAFHFDSVPAGRYAITVEQVGGTARKTQIDCTPTTSCRIAFVVKPLDVCEPDSYQPHYLDNQGIRH